MTSKRDIISQIARRPRRSRLGLSLDAAVHFRVNEPNIRKFQVAINKFDPGFFKGMAASKVVESEVKSI